MGKISRTPKALFWALALSAAWTAAPALAVPISDTIDPTNVLVTSGSVPSACPAGFTCAAGALTFVHDLTDQGFNIGAIITGATITIHLTEQVVTGQNNETFRYDIGLSPQIFTCSTGNCVPNGGVTNTTITLDAVALADLAVDGKISVTVTSLAGNLLFADSLLTAQVTDLVRLATSVPEPAPFLLIMAGLVGLGWHRRGLS